jgi:hypothetical protein
MSPVFDYTCRPTELEQMCLYDWIRVVQRSTLKSLRSRPSKKGRAKDESLESADDDIVGGDDSCRLDDVDYLPLQKGAYRFQPSHPLHTSHGVKLRKNSEKFVVNFLGAPLPRKD